MHNKIIRLYGITKLVKAVLVKAATPLNALKQRISSFISDLSATLCSQWVLVKQSLWQSPTVSTHRAHKQTQAQHFIKASLLSDFILNYFPTKQKLLQRMLICASRAP
jgi:hypothetical protein